MFKYFQRMVWLPSWSDLVRGSGQPQRSLGSFLEDQEGVSGASFLGVEGAVAHLKLQVLNMKILKYMYYIKTTIYRSERHIGFFFIIPNTCKILQFKIFYYNHI